MSAPAYRDIVLAFGGISALIGNMMDRGGAKLTLQVECDEDQFERVMTLAKLDPKDGMKIMGVRIVWKPRNE